MAEELNEEWVPRFHIQYHQKQYTVECDRCGGAGRMNSVFFTEDQCEKCKGDRFIPYEVKTKRPEVPQDLIEHMRRAWYDYFNKKN